MKETDKYFLALCGGGMDLSQNIGLAYLLTDGRIPYALAIQISTQPNLNYGKENYTKVMGGCISAIGESIQNAEFRLKRINESLKNDTR